MQDMPKAEAAVIRTVTVPLGRRSYDIEIGPGLLGKAGGAIQNVAPGARCAVVTDERVAQLHMATLSASLDAANLPHRAVVVAEGEGTKSFAQLEAVCDDLLDQGLERGDVVIALGGGVIGDLAGFAATLPVAKVDVLADEPAIAGVWRDGRVAMHDFDDDDIRNAPAHDPATGEIKELD